jgi:hypothetical protein
MKRKQLLLILLVALLTGAAVTVFLVDRDKRLTFLLARLSCDRKQYFDLLINHFEQGDERVKKRVSIVLDRLDEASVAYLMESFKDDDPARQAWSSRILVHAGPNKLGRLIQLFKDDDPPLQARIANVLIKAGADAALPLRTALASSDRPVRWWAVTLLGKTNSADPETAKALSGIVINDTDSWMRTAAVKSLGEIGSGAAKYIPEIVKMLEHQDPELRAAAARALGMIGAGAQETRANLTLALTDEDAVVRANAWEALHKIQADLPSS